MGKPKRKVSAAKPDPLFDRIVTILEQARNSVVRAVNTNMVLTYWLIGPEIVEDVQRGKGRAECGWSKDQLERQIHTLYLQFLPSEQELSLEIAKERRLIEDGMCDVVERNAR